MAPAADMSAPAAAPVLAGAAVSRPSFTGERFVLEADRVDSSLKEVVTASGWVMVRPLKPGGTYFAVVDGFSRTLTGVQEGVSAEIRQPGERLAIQTGTK